MNVLSNVLSNTIIIEKCPKSMISFFSIFAKVGHIFKINHFKAMKFCAWAVEKYVNAFNHMLAKTDVKSMQKSLLCSPQATRGHSITTWTRRGGEGVSRKSTLGEIG